MSTEDLIADLARQAVPVQPLPSPATRLSIWAATALTCAAIASLVFGVRSDAAVAIGEPGFIATAFFAVVTAGLAATACLILAIPGAERSPALRGSAIVMLVAWTGWLLISVLLDGYEPRALSHSPACFTRVLSIAALPAIALCVMLRRSAPLRLAWAGAMGLAAATGIGAAAIQFICPLDDPAHALAGHLGPVLVAVLLGIWAGPRWLDRFGRR